MLSIVPPRDVRLKPEPTSPIDSGSEVSTTSPRGSPSPEELSPHGDRHHQQLPRYHPYQGPVNEDSATWPRSRKSRYYTDYQQLVLERLYHENQYPDYEKIAVNLALTPHSVVYWFQARRRKQAKEKRVLEQSHPGSDGQRHAVQLLAKPGDHESPKENIMRLAQRSTPRKRQNPRKQSRPSNIREQRSESASPVTASPFQPANMFQTAGFQYPATLHQLAQMSGSYPLLQALSNVQAKTTGDRTDLDVLVEQREFLRRMLEHQEMLRYFWDQQLSMIQHLLSGCEARIVRERSRQQTNNNNSSGGNNNNNNTNHAISASKQPSTIHHIGQPLPAHSHPMALKQSPRQSPPGRSPPGQTPPGQDVVDGAPLMPWDAELRKLTQRAAEEAAKPRPAHLEARPAHSESRSAQLALDELSALCAKTNTPPYVPPPYASPPYVTPSTTESVLDLSQNNQNNQNNQSGARAPPTPVHRERSLPQDVPLTIDTQNDSGMDAYEFDGMDQSMNGDDSMLPEDDNGHEGNNLDALESARRRIRKRTSFSKYQLERLEEEFMTTHYPSSYERETIADALGLNYEQVRIWFKNRRRKEAVLRGMNDFDLKIPHPSQLQVKLDQHAVSMAM